MPTTVEFIPRQNRQHQHALLLEIANAVFGDAQKIGFMEEFVPPGGRAPSPKVQNFADFLINYPKCLWAVRFNNIVVGFILIADMPHRNSIGFGIDFNYKEKVIMKAAWALISLDKCIQYPLYGSTSTRNIGAQKFLTSIGFKNTHEDFDFMGEPSYKYVKQ